MKSILIIFLLMFAHSVAACPEVPEREDERAELLQRLKAADTYSKGSASIGAMWKFWRSAPDEIAQEMLDKGLTDIRIADYLAAEDVLSRLVAYCPNYAEGYNQLAFVQFLQGKYEPSISSLDRVLELEPEHFGALSGKALVYIEQGRDDIAQIFLRRAVTVNPWLNERHLLRPDNGNGDL